jgi:IPT/TIG domain
MSILTSAAASKTLRLGLAVGLASVAFVGAVATSQSAQAATAKSTLSPATGQGRANAAGAVTATGTIVLTGTGFTDAAGTSVVKADGGGATWTANTTGVQFNNATACPAAPATADGTAVINLTAATTPATYTVVSATRIVLTVPSLPLTSASGNWTSKAYRLCVYDNSGTPVLLADAAYTVYPQPTVSSVTPAQGALTGGNTVTVVGVNFTAKSTASLNGVPLTSVKVAKDLKSLTGVVPATSAIPVMTAFTTLGGSKYDLTVTTEGGPSTYTTANTNDDYTYVNAVTVSPKLSIQGSATPITVTGKGFNTILTPTNGVPAASAGVLLAINQYDSTNAGSVAATKASAGSACGSVTVVSDTELVCTVANNVPNGAYLVTVTDNTTAAIAIGATHQYQSVVSSSAVLAVAKS